MQKQIENEECLPKSSQQEQFVSETASKSRVPENRPARDWFGSIIGIMVFLGGIALLAMTFQMAYTMFTTPAERALQLKSGVGMDIAKAGTSLGDIIVRIFLLLVMAMVGSFVSNRGISLYSSSRALTSPKSE